MAWVTSAATGSTISRHELKEASSHSAFDHASTGILCRSKTVTESSHKSARCAASAVACFRFSAIEGSESAAIMRRAWSLTPVQFTPCSGALPGVALIENMVFICSRMPCIMEGSKGRPMFFRSSGFNDDAPSGLLLSLGSKPDSCIFLRKSSRGSRPSPESPLPGLLLFGELVIVYPFVPSYSARA